jgi:hypothetical protein
VQEGDPRPFRPRTRRAIEHGRAARAQALEHGLDARHAERHVVDPGPAPREEARHRRVLARGLEQLDPRVPRREERDLHPFRVHGLDSRHAQVEDLRPEGKAAREVLDRDADVVHRDRHGADPPPRTRSAAL